MHATLHAVDDRTMLLVLLKWLVVVALHLTLQSCVDAALVTLHSDRSLASLQCSACGALHLDAGVFATQKHVLHLCLECASKTKVAPTV